VSPAPVARPRPPRALIFDAGNTLLRMNYPAIARYLGGRGHAVTADQVHEAELRARVRLDVHLRPGASTESGATHGLYLQYVLEHLGIADPAEVADIAEWRQQYNRPIGLWELAEPGAAATLARVKAAGLVTGVISNSNGTVRSILERTGLADHLDFVVDSAVVGVEKPDRRIFEIALGHAGVTAAAALYVGDLYSVDVLGARRAGLEAVLLDPRGYWAPRDCPLARSLDHVVDLALGRADGPA
jgi:putative hydrolase of the HAD superfamily